jgi:short-subunit dehydrogenase
VSLALPGRTVLLTGASGGIGKAIARGLQARGAKLVLSGRRTDALEALRAELGEPAEVMTADLAERDAASALAEAAGAVDVLVANAALPASGRLESFTPEEIDRSIDVNLRAPVQIARALLPGMVDRDAGHLVFISSMSGKVASAGSALYSATKFGVRGLASGLREDLHGTGVGVSVVFPGFVSGEGMWGEAGLELPRGVSETPPEEVAAAVVRAVESGQAELDVAPLSLRAGALLSTLAPSLGAAVQRRMGARELASALAAAQRGKR